MKEKVLIIDDDFDFVKILIASLKEFDFNIHHVADGVFAMQEALRFIPDLILLDLQLPGGGGLVVLKNLKMSVKTNFIPVIVLTGMENEDYKNQVLQEGVEKIIQKPFERADLVEAIRAALKWPVHEPKAPEASSEMKKTICVIDDDEDILSLVQLRLKKSGYDVYIFSDPYQALAKLQAIKPDLVIVDIVMPNLNGWKLGLEMKKNEQLRDVPIILLSGMVSGHGPTAEGEVGTYMIQKPFEIGHLLEAVELCLKKKDSPSAGS